ncbi:MAG: hypothetical protein QXH91_09705 [Candidatus Bathyarchaeia archaeon]
MREKERQLVDSICRDICKTGQLTDRQKQTLQNTFGKRFKSALKALEDGAVKKYVFEPSQRTVWIVVGKERDYQIIPDVNFCSCDDFYFHVLKGESTLCYHLIAQKLADSLGRYALISDSDELYEALMKDWRFIKRDNSTTE